ncbi:MAG: DsbA family protein [Rhodospirillales bacterium]|nr:MAG: DsbA family protein [Rhodospirillales bacterium]
MPRQVLYFADPMCSWCWGFAPVLAAIRSTVGDMADMRLIVGGLRAGESRPMNARAKAVIRHHWEAVQAETGQPFSFGFFDREGFVYDTEPAGRAVVAMRCFAPEATLDYFAAVQRAFYADGQDVTDAAVLAALARPFGMDAEAFSILFTAAEIRDATHADFATTAAAGVSGFPTVVLRSGSHFDLLTAGYRPFTELEPAVRAWLNG